MMNNLESKKDDLYEIAHFDYLTGLLNRYSFKKDMEKLLKKVSEFDSCALLFIDLDGMKIVNDTMGHDFGDKLLIEFSQRLKNIVGNDVNCNEEDGCIYRVGGDEFIIIIKDYGRMLYLEDVLDSILKCASVPFTFDENKEIDFYVTASAGISTFPINEEFENINKHIDEIFKRSDIAMYHAKELGKNTYKFYSKSMHDKLLEKMKIQSYLRKAVTNKRDELELLYQPQIDIKTGKIVSLEALVRWYSQEIGFLMPSVFIPIAEETSLIYDIDYLLLERACIDIKEFNKKNNCNLTVAVNWSAKHLYKYSVADTIIDIIKRVGVSSSNIEIEITESGVASDIKAAIANIKKINDFGINVIIDDFGTGSSSLMYLKDFPIKKIKIDGYFVKDMLRNDFSKGIVNSMVSLSYHLDMKCIAEGIETKEQYEYLKNIGCDIAQGYYFSRPETLEKVEELVLRERKEEEIKKELSNSSSIYKIGDFFNKW